MRRIRKIKKRPTLHVDYGRSLIEGYKHNKFVKDNRYRLMDQITEKSILECEKWLPTLNKRKRLKKFNLTSLTPSNLASETFRVFEDRVMKAAEGGKKLTKKDLNEIMEDSVIAAKINLLWAAKRCKGPEF